MSNVYHVLANGNFSQNWNDPNLITADDSWAGVPSIIGYRGDNLVTTTGVDPTTVRGNDASPVVDVNANRTDPSVFTTGGVTEFHGTDGVVALQGSGTADAPYLVLHLDATGRQDLTFSTRLRDIDTASTAVQPIAVQYRIGETGDWSNVRTAMSRTPIPAGTRCSASRCPRRSTARPRCRSASSPPTRSVPTISSGSTISSSPARRSPSATASFRSPTHRWRKAIRARPN
jgi:hypothetical protein